MILFLFKLVLNVMLIATFLVLFYFYYVTDISKEIVIQQTIGMIHRLIPFVPHSRRIFSNKPKVDLEEQTTIDSHNQALRSLAFRYLIYLNASLGGVLLLLTIILFRKRKMKEMGGIVLHSLVMLGVIALTEYSFLQLIVKRYQLPDVNELGRKVVHYITQL